MSDDAEPTEGMGRAGYYDTHSEYQRAVADTAATLIQRCVAASPLPDADETYMVADYGCSTGANSIKMASNAVTAVRARQPGIAVAALHNDVPTNDFNQLFANLAAAPDSYLGMPGAMRRSFGPSPNPPCACICSPPPGRQPIASSTSTSPGSSRASPPTRWPTASRTGRSRSSWPARGRNPSAV